jgi:Protein of unknown function (DUF2845)
MLVAMGLACAHRAAAAEDVMRCGTTLVSVGMVAPEILAKCGEPASKEVEDVPIRMRGSPGAKVGVTRVERWTYDFGYGKFKRLLKFEDGKLKSIELLTSR